MNLEACLFRKGLQNLLCPWWLLDPRGAIRIAAVCIRYPAFKVPVSDCDLSSCCSCMSPSVLKGWHDTPAESIEAWKVASWATVLTSLIFPLTTTFPCLSRHWAKAAFSSLNATVLTPHFWYPVVTAPRPEQVSTCVLRVLCVHGWWPMMTDCWVCSRTTKPSSFCLRKWNRVTLCCFGIIVWILTSCLWIKVSTKVKDDPCQIGRTTQSTKVPSGVSFRLGSKWISPDMANPAQLSAR